MNPDNRLSLYRSLVTIRYAEEAIIRHYREDEMRTPMHMSMGQEACSVGVCAALRPVDLIFGYYRSHALYLARTGNIERFFEELYGKAPGTAGGRAGSMHLADPDAGMVFTSAVVAGSIPAAVGAGFAQKFRGAGGISCVFFGDGACDQGVFWESLNCACVMRLPVLFVCEDNGIAVHSPPNVRQGFDEIGSIVKGFRCGYAELTADEVENVAGLANVAAESARGNTPYFLRLHCYRYLDHIGIDEHFDESFRPRIDYDRWRERDATDGLKKKMLAEGVHAIDIESVEVEVLDRIAMAVSAAKALPYPESGRLLEGVYAEDRP